MTDMHEVVIVGGGPTGMMLAAELRLHDVDVVVLEKDAAPSRLVRSLGLHARSIEILDQRGILDRFLERGTVHPGVGRFAGLEPPEPPQLDTAHAYVLGIPQPVTDALLEERARELGADVRRGREVADLVQDEDGDGGSVTLTLSDGERVRARWAVACDGGRSPLRHLLGIGFPGEAATTEWLLGEMEVTSAPEEIATVSEQVRREHRGFGIGPSSTPRLFRAVVPASAAAEDRTEPPRFEEFLARLRAFAGTDFGAHSPTSLTRFTDATRLAETYRAGRVLLAGDAAHVHPPLGGQGLNLGIQDAANLGWKLAATIRGDAPAGLLGTYESERRAAAADVLTTTRAQSLLISGDPGAQALRRVLTDLLSVPAAARMLAERITGTGLRYDLGAAATENGRTADAAQELVGRRLPDMPIGDGRLFSHMHEARWLLLDPLGGFTLPAHLDQVVHLLDPAPRLGTPAALVRPDGHVAWAGADQATLETALAWWLPPVGGKARR